MTPQFGANDVVVLTSRGQAYLLVDAANAMQYAQKGLRMHVFPSADAVRALFFPIMGSTALPALRTHLAGTMGEQRANQLIAIAVVDEVAARVVSHQTAVFDAPLGSLAADSQRAQDKQAEKLMAALDTAGVFDPTPASDLASAAIALKQGDNFAASLSIISATVPYVGDAVAKPIKLLRAAFKHLKDLIPKSSVRVLAKASDNVSPVCTQLMEHLGLTRETVLYRAQDPKFLDMKNMTLAGNPKSMARVNDPYTSAWPNPMVEGYRKEGYELPEWIGNRGRELDAIELGPTLNVALKSPIGTTYAPAGHVVFGVRLGDVLDQGGRIYLDIGAAVQGIKPLIVTVPGRVPFKIVK